MAHGIRTADDAAHTLAAENARLRGELAHLERVIDTIPRAPAPAPVRRLHVLSGALLVAVAFLLGMTFAATVTDLATLLA